MQKSKAWSPVFVLGLHDGWLWTLFSEFKMSDTPPAILLLIFALMNPLLWVIFAFAGHAFYSASQAVIAGARNNVLVTGL